MIICKLIREHNKSITSTILHTYIQINYLNNYRKNETFSKVFDKIYLQGIYLFVEIQQQNYR